MTTARSLAIAAFLAFPLVASAGESGGAPNEATTAGKAPEAGSSVDKLKMGADLADMGREKKSPEMLLSAAAILAEVPSEAREPKKTEKAGEGKAEEKADQAAPTLDPAKLRAEALAFAQASGDKGLTKYVEAQIKKGAGDGTRGATGGAKYTVTKVTGGYTDIYNVEFRGGELAEVAIAGDGDTNLDIYVYDEYGNYIASDTGYTDTGYVSWYPRWTGGFRVEVRNNGMVYNQYVLITN